MIARHQQCFFLFLLLAFAVEAQAVEPPPEIGVPLIFQDVDGNRLSTGDGHITIITVVTRSNEKEAKTVAAQVPDRYLGDTKYRYVTLVNFQRKLAGPFRALTRSIIRRRLDAEASELKPKYAAKQITRDPRLDLFVIADFDGGAVSQLGLSPDSKEVVVFVLNGEGKLVERWTGVPPENALSKAIDRA